MTDKLKEFVAAHRQDFDALAAPAGLWTNIETGLSHKPGQWIKAKLLGKLGYLGFSASAIAVLVTTYLSLKSSEKPPTLDNPKFSANHAAIDQRLHFSPTASNNILTKNAGPANPGAKNNLPAISDSIKADEQVHSFSDTIGYNAGSAHNCVARPEQHGNELTAALINYDASPSAESDSLGFTSKPSLAQNAQRFSKKNNSLKGYPITTYSCSVLNWPCEAPISFSYPDSVNISGTITTSLCSELLGQKNVTAVRIRAPLAQAVLFTTKTAFANIRLVKPDGRVRPALAISNYQESWVVISKYIGNRFQAFYNDQFDLVLYFSGAYAGDKVVIDELIEAQIK